MVEKPTAQNRCRGYPLNSFAQGNPKPLENFAFSEITDLAFHGVASKVPVVGPWFENLVKAGQAARDLADEAKNGGCQ